MSAGVILVVNAGSSSVKFSLFRGTESHVLSLIVHGQVEGLGVRPRLTACDSEGRGLVDLEFAIGEVREASDAMHVAGAWLSEHFHDEPVIAVGHRVVHGGARYAQPVLMNEATYAELERLVPLAPLHQPHNLAGIRAVREWQPQMPQVACFDTAFHRTHGQLAELYALPWNCYEAGVRRYGFHGLSYEFIASALASIAPAIAGRRVIAAHLGNGASLCAMNAGRSVDSTMGFSALDGIPMGTRPGEIDPGALLYLVRQRGMQLGALEDMLYRQSGLLGISGISNDMRTLLASSEPRARLAVDYFVHCVAKEIGAFAAVLGGVDGFVFTAGIGENSPEIRARIVAACAWLGVTLDAEANLRGGPCISGDDSAVPVWVVPTNEELMIARHTLALVKGDGGRDAR